MIFVVIILNLFFANIAFANNNPRIVNGTNAEEGEFPYAVSLRYKSSHTCGGTILNEKYILTAAHCVCENETPRNTTLYSIQYNTNKITKDSINDNVVDVKEIFCHKFDSDQLIYDCAVLELSKSLPKDDFIPVQISKNFITKADQNGTIIGWGKISHTGPLATQLQKLKVNIYEDSICNKKYDSEHHICFGNPHGGACNGDSGTALIVDGIQVGIASFITNVCGISNKQNPNVYSRVSSYYEWISKIAHL